MIQEVKEILLTEEQIQKRVAELGRQITEDYAGKEVVLVGVLKGSIMFFTDLARHIQGDVKMDFISCSSYGSSTVSSGVVRILKDLDRPVEGKHVIVVEDIVDTGTTLSYLLDNLQSRKAASVRLCSFDVSIFSGITIPAASRGVFLLFSSASRFACSSSGLNKEP